MTASTPSVPVLPRDASLFTRLRIAARALWILKDDNANPDWARLLHLSLDDDTYERLARTLGATSDGRRLLDEQRTIPGEVGLDTLAKLPPGTLGHAFAHYFQSNGIFPFTYEYPLESEGDVLYKRYRETHDIHHIVTGYGIDPIGEIELQAFYVGNLGLRHAAVIGVVSLPYVVFKGYGLWKQLRRLRAAYLRGKQAPNLLAVHFDELWDRPVAELTATLCPTVPSPSPVASNANAAASLSGSA